jgi:hypothetical protein
MFRPVMLSLLIALAGCDRITGAADQKVSDAEAIGYACRVSFKKPEDCMKENDAQSTTSVLAGWRAADKDIQDKKLDPSMGTAVLAASASAATDVTTSAVPNEPSSEKASAPEKKPGKSH